MAAGQAVAEGAVEAADAELALRVAVEGETQTVEWPGSAAELVKAGPGPRS